MADASVITNNVRCSLNFHAIKVNDFPVFAGGVRDGIYGNSATFTEPPIDQAAFQLLLDAYNNTRYAYEQGGLAQRGPYREAKTALTNTLDVFAYYVNGIANGNENFITLAGYVPTKGSRSEAPEPEVPTGVVLKRGSKGVLLAECAKQDNAVSYGCILIADVPLPDTLIMTDNGQLQYVGDFDPTNASNAEASDHYSYARSIVDCNPSRKKTFINLKSGTTYYAVFYAANAAGVSQFSQTVHLMCG